MNDYNLDLQTFFFENVYKSYGAFMYRTHLRVELRNPDLEISGLDPLRGEILWQSLNSTILVWYPGSSNRA